MADLAGKHCILGITGGIAAYKSVMLASRLTQAGVAVDAIITDAGQQFVTPLQVSGVTNRNVYTSLWTEHVKQPGHIALSERADFILIAPLSANTLTKIALGFADNLLTTVVLAATCPLILAPAMNTNMYAKPIIQKHIATLTAEGATFIGPESGKLACGTVGLGRMSEPEKILEVVSSLSAAKLKTFGL